MDRLSSKEVFAAETDAAGVVDLEQKMLRIALREQRAILENAPVGIVFTLPGQFKSCNPRICEMLDYSYAELSHLSPLDVFTTAQAYQALVAEAYPVLASGGLFEKGEHPFKRRDGSLMWARLRGRAVDPAAREAGTIWIVEDVTDTRQALFEVQAIMTNATLGIMFTRNRIIQRYNPAFAAMFGYRDGEALGRSTRIVYPDDQSFIDFGERAYPQLARGIPYRAETEMVCKDGSRLWGQLNGYLFNPDDPDLGTIWMFEDRTRERADEIQLRNALMENRAILDNAVLGIAVVQDGLTLHCNSKMEELFGSPPGGMDGTPVRTLYPDEAAWHLARLDTARSFEEGQVHAAEYQMVRRDGSCFWVRLSGRLFDAAEKSGRSVWLLDDVTARREAAEAIRRARDELEIRVAERTAELAGANALLQEEINERRQAEARAHHMAYHDSLTGLPNRVLLSDRLDCALRAAQRSGRTLAVMFLDLDRFKTINDSLGHATGDHLLREVAKRLCAAVRDSDTVARLGGDEFVVLLPDAGGAAECALVGDKIIEALATPFPFEGHSLHISPSIGICLCPDDGDDVETLMRHADAAMYHAKAAGRNNYQFFDQRMNQAAARRFELESNLRGALGRDEFELHYQPIIDTATRRLHALEVLLRWRRAGGRLVGPDEFIPILEENGTIVPVGEWVIRSACEQSVAWQAQGLAAVPLAINLSARQFMHDGLVESMRRIVGETGIDPALVEFEITETALMQHGGQTLEILRQINGMGMRLSIDDFGTGYSSLAYLKRFPVRKIKIDRAFVRELEASAEDRAIVAAVMALANSLQLSVVAEGVETEGQYALLGSYGCQFAQGYLFARPLPACDTARLLVIEPTVIPGSQ
ncbi:bifunctional diguanylate cyclase/phosphodiesterase [Massilia yuzhufengensis]|uniref:PAS domain S-box-containing protein/diguanylate cyclase (GGDEF) domain-containing protein n=1 Tax=Massilia yuzhufengensis TaxID=1164594 RepID=A0A1I1K8Q1_9BURK|nr:EAL domain-containing protein [Massilia yuzhufengensis]SFC57259.1 PAS domain S-box-containing protein/diguanylate cyclase (GGDEF) domain-containing protein [Massilia yuzhufengensis]